MTNKNPFKIHLNIEEEIKKVASESEINKNKSEIETNANNEIDLTKKIENTDNNNKQTENSKYKKTQKEIPKISVLDVVKKGVNVKTPKWIEENMLVKRIEEKKKRKKIFKAVMGLFILSSIIGVGIFGYYKKDMLASLLGNQVVKEVNILPKDYSPLSKNDFSPATRFFYDIYIRDYDFIYKTFSGQERTKFLWQLNVTISDFIKNEIDYITFRGKYSKIILRMYYKLLKNKSKENNIKMPPWWEGEHSAPNKTNTLNNNDNK